MSKGANNIENTVIVEVIVEVGTENSIFFFKSVCVYVGLIVDKSWNQYSCDLLMSLDQTQNSPNILDNISVGLLGVRKYTHIGSVSIYTFSYGPTAAQYVDFIIGGNSEFLEYRRAFFSFCRNSCHFNPFVYTFLFGEFSVKNMVECLDKFFLVGKGTNICPR